MKSKKKNRSPKCAHTLFCFYCKSIEDWISFSDPLVVSLFLPLFHTFTFLLFICASVLFLIDASSFFFLLAKIPLIYSLWFCTATDDGEVWASTKLNGIPVYLTLEVFQLMGQYTQYIKYVYWRCKLNLIFFFFRFVHKFLQNKKNKEKTTTKTNEKKENIFFLIIFSVDDFFLLGWKKYFRFCSPIKLCDIYICTFVQKRETSQQLFAFSVSLFSIFISIYRLKNHFLSESVLIKNKNKKKGKRKKKII